MRKTERAGSRLIGFGIGFLALAFLILPMLFEIGDDRPSIFSQIFNTYGIGIVYLLFGLLMVSWGRLTRSNQFPFRVAVLTTGIALTVIIGIWMFVPLSTTPFRSATTPVENLLVSPDLWIGWYFAWMGAYNFAEVRYQRIVSTVGLAIVPLSIIAGIVLKMAHTADSSGATLVPLYGIVLLAGSLFSIAVTGLYSLPFWYVSRWQDDSLIRNRTQN